MTRIPKEHMSSTTRAPAAQPDDQQRDSVPSSFTVVDKPSDSDSDTETRESGNWGGEFFSAKMNATSNAASEWLKKASGSVSMKRIMMMMRDRYASCSLIAYPALSLTDIQMPHQVHCRNGVDWRRQVVCDQDPHRKRSFCRARYQRRYHSVSPSFV